MSACSRLADYEQIKRNWLKHEDRLIHIKSTLNTRRPMPKIPSSKKTNFTQTLDVQFENKALLKKLTDRGSQSRQEVSICCQSANPLPKSNRKKYYEDYRIRNQNEGLYKRLKKTKPIIDTQSFKMQRTQTERLLNTISKFGYKNLKPTKTVIKFDLLNNQLKYLSRRKILLNQQLKHSQCSSLSPQSREQKLINKILQKHKQNEKIFNYLSRFRHVTIDSQETIIKITRGTTSIKIQLASVLDKENKDGEMQVQLSHQIFKEKYNESLQELISRLKYNQSKNAYYIL